MRSSIDNPGGHNAVFCHRAGGGTVRDILLPRPVFWISDQIYLVVALAITLVVFSAGK